MGFYYGYLNYLIFMIPAIIVSLVAQISVSTNFSRYSKINNVRGITGAEAARRVLQYGGLNNVEIRPISGKLSDNFDPRTNIISLSEDVFNSTSISAVGVAAHEAGHAIQHAEGYGPIKLRSAMVPVTRIGSFASLPIILFGYFLSIQPLVMAGIILFSLAVIFSVITLPVEFNASNRAIKVLSSSNIVYDTELVGVKKVLRSAAMTYVANTFTQLWSLLRLILIFGGRRN